MPAELGQEGAWCSQGGPRGLSTGATGSLRGLEPCVPVPGARDSRLEPRALCPARRAFRLTTATASSPQKHREVPVITPILQTRKLRHGGIHSLV